MAKYHEFEVRFIGRQPSQEEIETLNAKATELDRHFPGFEPVKECVAGTRMNGSREWREPVVTLNELFSLLSEMNLNAQMRLDPIERIFDGEAFETCSPEWHYGGIDSSHYVMTKDVLINNVARFNANELRNIARFATELADAKDVSNFRKK